MGRCGCGADPMGYLWGAVAAVPSVWGIYGVLWLRCQPYGAHMGRCGCGTGPMGDLWAAVTAVTTLWEMYGHVCMHACMYVRNVCLYVWDCGVGPMGDLWGVHGDLWGDYECTYVCMCKCM